MQPLRTAKDIIAYDRQQVESVGIGPNLSAIQDKNNSLKPVEYHSL